MAQVYEGTPDQLVKQLNKLSGTRKYKLTVEPEDLKGPPVPPKMISFGLFPQLQSLSDDDFKSAEWTGREIEL